MIVTWIIIDWLETPEHHHMGTNSMSPYWSTDQFEIDIYIISESVE